MRNFSKLKVRVTGCEPEPVVAQQQKLTPIVEKHTISVDMKNNKVVTTKNQDEKDTYQLFKNVKDCIDKGSISLIAGAHLINLEIKKMYIVCIGDEHLDVDANEYLDTILFNSIEELILSLISTDNDTSLKSLEEVINQTIANTVKLLDYDEQFDYKKMNETIAHIVEVFG